MSSCPECGAVQPRGASCRECFDALLAFEFEHPVAFGAVHQLTVASYYLQHPSGYSLEALDAWREVLRGSQDNGRTQRDLLAAMSARFEGARSVRDSKATRPAWWPQTWPMTIRDAFDPSAERPGVEEYIERARAWVASVQQCLADAALPVSRGRRNVSS